MGVSVWVWVWVWLCGCGCVGVSVCDIHLSKLGFAPRHFRLFKSQVQSLTWQRELGVLSDLLCFIIFDSKFFPSLESLIDNINCGLTLLAIYLDCGANEWVVHQEAMWQPAGTLRGAGVTRGDMTTTSPTWQLASALRGGGASRGDAMWHNCSIIAMDNGSDITMDGKMVAWFWWVTLAAMGDRGCHDGRWQWWQQDCNGGQLWWCNGRQDSSAIVMAIAMNGNGGNRRQQWQWEGLQWVTMAASQMAAQSLCAASRSQWTVAAVMGNGRETVAIDNGADMQWTARWQRNCDGWWCQKLVTVGVTMGEGNSGSRITMGDNGGGTTDDGTAAQLWWQSPWTAAAAIGHNDDGGIAMGDGGCGAMDGVTAAQMPYAALQLRWTVVAVMDNGR